MARLNRRLLSSARYNGDRVRGGLSPEPVVGAARRARVAHPRIAAVGADGEVVFPYGFGAYRDSGCKAQPSCLTCPFERCLEDVADERAAQRAAAQAALAVWERERGRTPERGEGRA